ncbi:lipoprotein [Spiroplasma cantharicola]|uniref:Lipoprotein n=1 Tax=Spiroplasma cantharicola TaxID=362837 RepID=A0A0M4JJI3_9MOLU|nr:lipoprotein [Spiroplasma cantharicola]ALD66361.1 hypothetical protein SCANT_v1c04550 [Spiroplasma cantharicola]
MRKLLAILGSIGLLASTSVTVAACNPKQEKFIIPAFPETVEEAQKIISDLSKPYALTELEITKLEEEEEEEFDNLTEILNLTIKNKFNEYEAILFASIFKIAELEGMESKIKIWEFDEDNMIVEEIETSINEYSTEPEDVFFYYLEDNINSSSTFPNEVIGGEEMVNNLKDIRKWWLDGKKMEAFSDQFSSFKVVLKEEKQEEEALEKVIELRKNEDITIENIKFYAWSNNGTEKINWFIVGPKSNNKVLGLALFEFTTE